MHPSHPQATPPHPASPPRRSDRLLEPQGPAADADIVPLGDPLLSRIARGLVLPGGPGRPPAEPRVRRSGVSGREADGRTTAAA